MAAQHLPRNLALPTVNRSRSKEDEEKDEQEESF